MADASELVLSPDWPDIGLSGPGEVVVGRSRECAVRLGHASIGRRHARFVRSEGGVDVEDLDSRFGTSVNGVFIRRTRLKPGDLVRFGTGSTYRFFGDVLRVEVDAAGLSIRLSDVVFERGGRRLLDGLNLDLAPGSYVALLGPSGAGKSLLLGCLATTIEPTGGSVTFDDGKPLTGAHLQYYRSKLGVVQQEDLVFQALTVRENLRFASRLRLADTSRADASRQLDAIIEDVGLSSHQDKQVAVLSGGQRKRVSVAIELLTRPRLLLLDEPTSGLDPGMQARVMDMLRGLSRQGITIVVSTHTLDTLHYFDSVIVLAPGGRGTGVVYQGPPSGLLPAFSVQDMADLFDKLARGEAPEPGPAVSEGAPGNDTGETNAAEGTGASPGIGPAPPMVAPIAPAPAAPATGFGPVRRQAGMVMHRSFLGFIRDAAALQLAIAQPFTLALLIVVSQANLPKSTFIHFYLVVAAIWLGMTLTVRELVRERSLYLRDRLAGLRPVSYLFGKAGFGIVAAIGQALVLFLFARLLVPLLVSNKDASTQLTDTSLFWGSVVVALACVGGSLIGLTLSTLAKSEQAAVALLPLVILPQVLFSRVASGDAGYLAWDEPKGSFTELRHLWPAVDQDDFTRSKCIVLVASLPMLSRPATAALDILHLNDPGALAVAAEWSYLVLLIVLLATTSYFVFRWREGRWRLSR